ncbi:malonate decarboxylase holo-[acyl-carrier-protein] synthase [Oxalobacteraceae bacterium]|nr:malonate decarboxylase holo-[acyl-carrier-protein] synthase [Oxalobacteraceae bacterium]
MLSRHDLVWLTSAGWEAAQAAATPHNAAALGRWQANDWPAIVRRRDADAGVDEVCLGVALPPDASGNKARIGLRARLSHIAHTTPPLSIAAAVSAAPSGWVAALGTMAHSATAPGFQIYGSLALQALTGLPYVHEHSDVDLLFRPASVTGLRAGLALMSNCAARIPLDGEIIFPSGQAVAWREWRMAGAVNAKVMIKEQKSVRLAVPEELIATLEQR